MGAAPSEGAREPRLADPWRPATLGEVDSAISDVIAKLDAYAPLMQESPPPSGFPRAWLEPSPEPAERSGRDPAPTRSHGDAEPAVFSGPSAFSEPLPEERQLRPTGKTVKLPVITREHVERYGRDRSSILEARRFGLEYSLVLGRACREKGYSQETLVKAATDEVMDALMEAACEEVIACMSDIAREVVYSRGEEDPVIAAGLAGGVPGSGGNAFPEEAAEVPISEGLSAPDFGISV